jgi:hypothetical protein
MVRFTVHTLGEHIIDNLLVSGPCREIIMTMIDMFLATYSGPPNGDLDYYFAEYVIEMSMGQGTILEWLPPPIGEIH